MLAFCEEETKFTFKIRKTSSAPTSGADKNINAPQVGADKKLFAPTLLQGNHMPTFIGLHPSAMIGKTPGPSQPRQSYFILSCYSAPGLVASPARWVETNFPGAINQGQ